MIQTRNKKHLSKLSLRSMHWFSVVLTLVFIFGLSFFTSAQAQDFARGYSSRDEGLKPGMVVALSDGTKDKPEVERAGDKDLSKIIGVTVLSRDTLVTIASGDDRVYVQSKGEVDVYATDINGVIKKGDAVAVSSLRGLVMRGTNDTARIGLALEDFPEANEDITIVKEDGTTQIVRLAKIKITLANGIAERASGSFESPLERLGRSITGRTVGELQVIIALIIFIIVMIAEASIIYGSVSSAITSLGRNPLARKVIVRELIRVFLMVVVVFAVGVGSIYIIISI